MSTALDALTSALAIQSRIVTRMPWDQYRALPGVSITRLKEMRRSPRHYRHALQSPRESAALTLGTAAHCAVLEPERFGGEYAVWGERTDGGRLRPRNGATWEAFASMHATRTILTEDEHIHACAIRDAVRGDPNAMRYLRAGDPEVTLQWTDEETSTQMRGRVDWLTEVDGRPVIVGLKTTRDVRSELFGAQAAKLGYCPQWSAYFDGYIAITGVTPAIVEIVVESAPPHDVGVYVPRDDVLDIGRNEYRDLLVRLMQCEQSGKWPGAVPNETDVVLPKWAYPTDDDIADLGLTGIETE